MYQSVKAIRAHKYMQFWRDELFKPLNSWTVEARVANQRAIFTADPENIKAILATQFADYGKGKPFHDVWKEFLGDSIFATDGQLWSNSRKLIRPHFNRDRVSDLECIEERIGTLLRAIANGGALDSENQEVDVRRANGKQVEISDILYRFTLDVATQFLLGCDVQSLT
jgi:cytochrome P450